MKMKVEYWGVEVVYARAIVFDADKYTCECPLRCSQKLTISVSQTGWHISCLGEGHIKRDSSWTSPSSMVSLFGCPCKIPRYVFNLPVLMSRVLKPNPFAFAFHILPRKSQDFLFIAFSGMYTDLEFAPFLLVLLWSDRKLYLLAYVKFFWVLTMARCSPSIREKHRAQGSGGQHRASGEWKIPEVWALHSSELAAILDHMEIGINIISVGT